MPLVEFPAAPPHPPLALETATHVAVDVQHAYVYLLRVVDIQMSTLLPSAKIPLVELPTALPHRDAVLAAPTPDDVDASDAYVYLSRVATIQLLTADKLPNAKIPLVEFPVADCCLDAELALATPLAVDVHDA